MKVHSGVVGNERADKEARKTGSSSTLISYTQIDRFVDR